MSIWHLVGKGYRLLLKVMARREGSFQREEGEAPGLVSLLAERAPSEGPRSTRAVETTPATSCELGNGGNLNKGGEATSLRRHSRLAGVYKRGAHDSSRRIKESDPLISVLNLGFTGVMICD